MKRYLLLTLLLPACQPLTGENPLNRLEIVTNGPGPRNVSVNAAMAAPAGPVYFAPSPDPVGPPPMLGGGHE